MPHPLNGFVAGPGGGPTITLTLGPTLDLLAASEVSDLRPSSPSRASGGPGELHFEWSGRLLDWLNFVDCCSAIAETGEDEDLGLLVRWLDEDLDAAMQDVR